jgi:tRNA threonylcarbamoyladenosine modification (KEOPS) complex Cgi121 subunit
MRVLKRLQDEGRYLLIAGFSGKERIEVSRVFDWIQTQGLAVQIFDAKSIAGWRHVYYAVVNAMTAFRTGRNITRSLPIEILLYVSGQDQIDKALQVVGIEDSTSRICLVAVADSEDEATNFQERFQRRFSLQRDDSVLEIQDEGKIRHLKEAFSIGDLEMEAMINGELSREEALRGLLIERGALLATRK